LRRVGCYGGQINGDWTLAARNAMKDFTVYVNARLPVDKPDEVLLSLVNGYEGTACNGQCPTGQSFRDGRCIPTALVAKKPDDARLAEHTANPETQVIGSSQSPPSGGRMALAGPAADSNPTQLAQQPTSAATHHAQGRNSTSRAALPRAARPFGGSIFTRMATFSH
jgi:hypothetical protein